MATIDNERYLRLALLTHDGGTWISKRILVRELDRLPGSPSLTSFLVSKKLYLTEKKNCQDLTAIQYRALFPSDGSDTNIDDWDLHLILKVTIEFFTSGQENSDLRPILQIRNKLCHSSGPTLSEREFLSSWTILVECICRLASRFDEDTRQKASKIIGGFRDGPLSIYDSVEKLHQLYRNEEHMRNILNALARFKHSQDVCEMRLASLEKKVGEIPSYGNKLDEILNTVKAIQAIQSSNTASVDTVKTQSSKTSTVDIPILQLQMNISGENEEVVKTFEDLALRILKAAEYKAENPINEDSINCAMREIIQEIEGQDAEVDSAEKGSILINVRCHTLSGLQKLLVWLKEKEYRCYLQKLERALEAKFQSKMNLDLTMSKVGILKLSDWSEQCLSSLVNTKSDELPHNGKVNIGVKCQSTDAVSRVVVYLTQGDAANRLDMLSKLLSDTAGYNIKVHATLDTEKLLNDLRKVQTDLSAHQMSPQLMTQNTLDEPQKAELKGETGDVSSRTNKPLSSSAGDPELRTLTNKVDEVRADMDRLHVKHQELKTNLADIETRQDSTVDDYKQIRDSLLEIRKQIPKMASILESIQQAHEPGLDEKVADLKSRLQELDDNVREDTEQVLKRLQSTVAIFEGRLHEHVSQEDEEKEKEEEYIVKRLQHTLVERYQERQQRAPIWPLTSTSTKTLEDLYVKPRMVIEDPLGHCAESDKSTVQASKGPTKRNSEEEAKSQEQVDPIDKFEDIFYADGKLCKRIFISADAGKGKTSLCEYLVSLWVRNQQKRPMASDDEFMAVFTFLFYVSLREADITFRQGYRVDEMIASQLRLRDFNVKQLMGDYTCLIIMDGLDKLTQKRDTGSTASGSLGLPAIPHMADKCVFLTTSRPLQLEELAPELEGMIDRQIKIEGLDSMSQRELIQRVISMLNDEQGKTKTTADFMDDLQKHNLTEYLKTPLILMQMLHMWFDGLPLGDALWLKRN